MNLLVFRQMHTLCIYRSFITDDAIYALFFVKMYKSQGDVRLLVSGEIASRDQTLPWSFSSSFLSSMFLLIRQASTTYIVFRKSMLIHTRVALEKPHLPPTSFQLLSQNISAKAGAKLLLSSSYSC